MNPLEVKIESLKSTLPQCIEDRFVYLREILELIDTGQASIKDLQSYPPSLFLNELDYSYEEFVERHTRYESPTIIGTYRDTTCDTSRILWMIGDSHSVQQAIRAMSALIDFLNNDPEVKKGWHPSIPSKKEIMLLEMMKSDAEYPVDWPAREKQWWEDDEPKRKERERLQQIRWEKKFGRESTASKNGRIIIFTAGVILLLFFIIILNKDNQTSSVSVPNIKNLDFRNYTYFPSPEAQKYYTWPKEIKVKDGKYTNEEEGTVFDIGDVFFSDLTGDGSDEAIINTGYSFIRGNFWESEIHIYSLRNGRVILIARLGENDTQRDYRKYYPVNPETLEGDMWRTRAIKPINNILTIEREVDGPHCCPENVAIMNYRWDGQKMSLQSKPIKTKIQR